MMHRYFPKTFLDTIPTELLQVPDNVLEITGISVTAQAFSDQFKSEQPYFSLSEAVLDIDPDRSAITIWFDPASVTPSTLGHELLHLRRNIVESVPKLFPLANCSSDMAEEILCIENELEHLLLVPEQIAAFPGAELWWRDHYSALNSRILRDNTTLMFAWSFIRNVLPQQIELAQSYVTLLKKYDFVNPAEYLREDMRVTMPDKLEMLRKTLEGFSHLHTHSSVGRYVITAGKLTLRPVSL
jgi:hypothetical protein